MDNNTHPLLTLPSSIVIAGVVIAIAIIWSRNPTVQIVKQDDTKQQEAKITVSPVTKDDHIFGNPNAPIKIVEYSDPSCPFCKTFNPTMEKIMTEYGPAGKVAWIYRAFPLDKPRPDGSVLHPNAGRQSQAFECANALGGNDKFWAYEKAWYNTFPLQGATGRSVAEDTKQLVEIAKDNGLDTVAFNECLTSETYKNKVEKQYLMGVNDGVSGTPYSLILSSNGKIAPINGAQPYENIKSILDSMLAEVK